MPKLKLRPHDIAFDKLKHDLFERRYEICTAAKGIIERVIRTGTERPIDDLELLAMRIKLDEGRFFFPPKPVALFETIDQLTTQHEVARMSWERDNDNDAIRVRQGDVMGDAIAKLSEIHRQFPKLMQAKWSSRNLPHRIGTSCSRLQWHMTLLSPTALPLKGRSERGQLGDGCSSLGVELSKICRSCIMAA